MHPSRTPHHAYQTPMRDPGGLFSFVLIFLSVPNFQWMKGYFCLAHMHSLIFSCLSLSPYRKLLSFDQYICLLISICFEDYGVFVRGKIILIVLCLCMGCVFVSILFVDMKREPKLFSNHFTSVPTLVNLEWESIDAFCTIHLVFAMRLVCSVIICPFNCYSNTNT